MKQATKNSCAQCETDTKVVQYRVRSNRYNAYFCDMECFNTYTKRLEKELDRENKRD